METKVKVTLIEKSGRHYHGTMTDSWVRVSGAKLRGAVSFTSEEKGDIEVDANDILDVVMPEGNLK